MVKNYLYVWKKGEKENASVKGFTDPSKAKEEKNFFEMLGYCCEIRKEVNI